MCGICGKLIFDPQASVSPVLVESMANSISHRGPDDSGFYISANIGLGFRRLSIIDLKSGHQPLSNEDGSVWIVFNGEIYNFRDLREDLLQRGHTFKTRSDTEVIVHLYEDFGERCVEKLRGMFAFAIWDKRARSLFLARDRVGIKPLYYSLSPRSLVFASEIKALLALPGLSPEINPQILDRFLTFYYVPGDETIFRNIKKLSPGTTLTVREGKLSHRQYWDLSFEPSPIAARQAESRLLDILEESVSLHMISDVPVGFLLSGGIDSTAMLGLAPKTQHTLRTFTIGFSYPQVTDERPYARLAAARLGAEHRETSFNAQDFAAFLPGYIHIMEEPVCEPPAVALYYVTHLAKPHVKVLISGEGGDEAFAGYENYRTLLWLERAKRLLAPASAALSRTLSASGPRASKFAPLFSHSLGEFYLSRSSSPATYFNSSWRQLYSPDLLASINKAASLDPVSRFHYRSSGRGFDPLSRMLYVDTKTWLPDDLLIKADKMTMANSIELRVPLLDHKVLEFAASLPPQLKVRGFVTKYIAKRALASHVPREILHRKKTGFPVPYALWLRRDLERWVRSILLEKRTVERGLFCKTAVEQLLFANLQTGCFSKEVFSLLILELWHRRFIDHDPVTPRFLPPHVSSQTISPRPPVASQAP